MVNRSRVAKQTKGRASDHFERPQHLLQAMKIVTKVAGVTYRIDGQVVVIEPTTSEPKK